MTKFHFGIYVGRKNHLKGERAMIRPIENSIFVDAQFNNVDTGLGYGWHEFYASDFQIDNGD